MKKLQLFCLLLLCALTAFSQAKTSNHIYYKIKPGQRTAFNTALKTHVEKYRKAGSPSAWSVFNVVGGSHHNEVMAVFNNGLSWAQRDELASVPPNTEASNDFYLKVSPFIDEVTGGEIITYQPEYSNSTMEERSAKLRTSLLTLKYAPGEDFYDVIKRLPKAWDKAGLKIATYTSSGINRLMFIRRFPNGWKELDEPSKLKNAYDELYGKGAFERDIAIMRNYIIENETVYLTYQPDLSSK